uniref:Uncharacterized protein n=1 Tax=Sipha flava TaxID=143950 RepID=A0A2S2PV33_9HEMI
MRRRERETERVACARAGGGDTARSSVVAVTGWCACARELCGRAGARACACENRRERKNVRTTSSSFMTSSCLLSFVSSPPPPPPSPTLPRARVRESESVRSGSAE